MYTLTFNDNTIYDPRLPEYAVSSCNVNFEVGTSGSLTIDFPKDHPSLSSLTRMKGTLALLEDGNVIYKGRIIKSTKNLYGDVHIESEGALGYLNDSVYPAFIYPDNFPSVTGNTVEYFLGLLIANHNSQVTAAQQIQLGTVSVTDSNNYIKRSSDKPMSTYEIIKSKLVDTLGGYLMIRYESSGNYLDYLSSLPLTNTQTVEFAKNITDLSDEYDTSTSYTAIVPIGADGLTISSYPDGAITADIVKSGNMVYSTTGRSEFGNICKAVEWSDVTMTANLISKASALLTGEGILTSRTLNISAVDLHCVDSDISAFRVGRNNIVVYDISGTSATFPLLAMDIDVLNPANTTITLSQLDWSLSGNSVTSTREISEEIQTNKVEIGKVDRELSQVVSETRQAITSAIQNSQQIIFTALEDYVRSGDLETYKSQVSTMFEQTAEQIQMTFTTVEQEITDVNGDRQNKYNERVRYIRFVDGNIVLGSEDSAITLVQQNDRISFRQNGSEIAYFAYNKFYITSAEFLTSAQIGNFAFLPGYSGNLSFRKVR